MGFLVTGSTSSTSSSPSNLPSVMKPSTSSARAVSRRVPQGDLTYRLLPSSLLPNRLLPRQMPKNFEIKYLNSEKFRGPKSSKFNTLQLSPNGRTKCSNREPTIGNHQMNCCGSNATNRFNSGAFCGENEFLGTEVQNRNLGNNQRGRFRTSHCFGGIDLLNPVQAMSTGY